MYTKNIIYIHYVKSVHTYSIHPFIYTDVKGVYSFIYPLQSLYLCARYTRFSLDLIRLFYRFNYVVGVLPPYNNDYPLTQNQSDLPGGVTLQMIHSKVFTFSA